MNVKIEPAVLSGTTAAISSKSDLHRLLICAALADAPAVIQLDQKAELSDDVTATIECLQALGAEISVQPGAIHVQPVRRVPDLPVLDCGESGSTLRFLIPVAAALCPASSFRGHGRLPDRPVTDLLHTLEQNGVTVSPERLPFSIRGKLQSGTFRLPGNISSQYITGLLLALPLLDGDSRILLTSPLQSASYISITLHALARFGVRAGTLAVSEDAPHGGFTVPGGQVFHSPGALRADGDWSNAAFFLAAGAIGARHGGRDRGTGAGRAEGAVPAVSVAGLDCGSPQGDKAIAGLLRRFGADVRTDGPRGAAGIAVTARPGVLRGQTIDLTDIPDLLPVLAVTAAAAEGVTRFTGGERLRLKESDRIRSVRVMLEQLGGTAEELPDGLLVTGGPLTGGTVDSFHDHRIVMAAAVAALSASGPTVITGAEAVRKSYPAFFEDYNQLGGHADVI